MSDFKFDCPKCGQNIVCDTSNAGMQIPCPACQNVLTVPKPPAVASVPGVPAGPGKLSIRRTASHSAPQPAPPPPGAANAPAKPTWGAQSVAAAPKRTSALAIVSLVCSLLGGLGCLPAIICGHIARVRIAKDSSLKGKGLATAGLIIGYLSLVLIVGWYGFGAPYLQKQIEIKKQADEAAARQAAEEQAKLEAAAAKARLAKAEWNLDLADPHFPERHASGKLHGANFSVDAAAFQNGYLILRQNNGLAGQFQIGVPLKAGEKLSGKSVQIASTDAAAVPRVAINWKEESPKPPGTQVFSKGYALKLEFGEAIDGRMSGKIYLCLPDDEQSYVAGNFELGGKKPGPNRPAAAGQPGEQPPRRKRQPSGQPPPGTQPPPQ